MDADNFEQVASVVDQLLESVDNDLGTVIDPHKFSGD